MKMQLLEAPKSRKAAFDPNKTTFYPSKPLFTPAGAAKGVPQKIASQDRLHPPVPTLKASFTSTKSPNSKPYQKPTRSRPSTPKSTKKSQNDSSMDSNNSQKGKEEKSTAMLRLQ